MSNSVVFAKSAPIKTSVQKLNLVCKMISGMRVEDALLQLRFCKRGVARPVKSVLESAISNAENNKGLDIDRLYISEILVGKAMVLKRYRPRARGRVGGIKKRFSKLVLFVKEGV